MTTNYSKDTVFNRQGVKVLRSDSAFEKMINKPNQYWEDFNYMKLNKVEKNIVKGTKE